MSRPDILITRPEDDAWRLSSLLQAHGFSPLVEPMSKIVAAREPPPPLDDIAAVIFTSAHGAALLPYELLLPSWPSWPCYCVGDRTTAAAQKQGWKKTIAGGGDGFELGAIIRQTQGPEQGTLLHVCGADLSREPDDSLRRAGYGITHWPVYRAEAAIELSPACREALAGSLRAALFFSPRSAQIFAELAGQSDLTACCRRLIALCLSEAVADAAKALPWQQVIVASAPHEAALIEALCETMAR
ncbi:MAG: uroporphyrinogen-III synthase [Alphaproteobacteria bacterium]